MAPAIDRAPKPLPCPKCGRPVVVTPQDGGRGAGQLTNYQVICECGLREQYFGNNGTKRSAIAHWNRWVKAMKAAKK